MLNNARLYQSLATLEKWLYLLLVALDAHAKRGVMVEERLATSLVDFLNEMKSKAELQVYHNCIDAILKKLGHKMV